MIEAYPTLVQQELIAKERRYKRQVTTYRVMPLALLLALWRLYARLSVIDDSIFSSPSRMVRYLAGMVADGSILVHTGITILETLVNFGLVVVAEILFTVLLQASRSISEVLEPCLIMLNSLPKSALAPTLIVWLRNNVKTIIVTAISVTVFGSILALHTGFKQMDPGKIRLIYALGGRKEDVLLKVLIPNSIPLIISNMKVNIGLCLVGVTTGELLAASKGLGYLIIYGGQVFKMDMVVVSVVILCIVSAILYQGIAILEKRIK